MIVFTFGEALAILGLADFGGEPGFMAYDHAIVGRDYHVEFQGFYGRIVEGTQEGGDGIFGQ